MMDKFLHFYLYLLFPSRIRTDKYRTRGWLCTVEIRMLVTLLSITKVWCQLYCIL